jgi:capsular exopolysaccharide synthesis family protein
VVLPPIYEASTSLIVNERSNVAQPTSGVDYGQIQTYRSLAVTYAKIITSRAVLQDTIDTLQLPETVKQLTQMTTVQVEGETEIIAISVKDEDAIRAATIANTMANSFITQLPTLVSRVEHVSVIDRAVPVTDQVSPRPLLNIAVAMIAALVLGVLLAFLVDYFDDKVKTPDDVKKFFGLRVLSVIPDTNARGVGHGSAVKSNNYGYGDYKGSHSPVAEAFRVLRANLQFAAVDKEMKVILVTSASPNDGKSTVVQYLAQIISQTGKKVLVVDADLINPTLHRRFDFPNQRGLSNLIVGDADFTVFARPKEYPNLSVITTGPIPPNSSELLGSTRMKHLMDRLREEYDVIIMDTPPILPVTDAVVVSSLADGAILVVQAGKTRSGEVRHAQEVLETAHANLLGVVLNRVRRTVNDYYYTRTYGTEPAKPDETPSQP